MKKTKRILAILGIILLAALYIATLVFAIIGSEASMNWFRASVYATIVVPVLIWAYGFIYRLLKDHFSLRDDAATPPSHEESQEDGEEKQDIS